MLPHEADVESLSLPACGDLQAQWSCPGSAVSPHLLHNTRVLLVNSHCGDSEKPRLGVGRVPSNYDLRVKALGAMKSPSFPRKVLTVFRVF